METDGTLIYLDKDIGKKIQDVISTRRFDYKDAEDNKYINDLISFVNRLMNTPKDEMISDMENYLGVLAEDRGAIYRDSKVIFMTNSSDIIYYLYLTSDFEVSEWSDELFLFSLNYFINTIPEMFTGKVLEKAKDTMNVISKRTKFYNRNAKKLLKISNKKLDNIRNDKNE